MNPPAPAQMLPVRHSTHVRDGLLLFSAGLAGAGAASVSGNLEWAPASLALGGGSGAIVTAAGARKRLRRQIRDRLVEALAPPLGIRVQILDRRIVALRSWSRGWPGLPGEIRLAYAPAAEITDPKWLPTILARVSAQLLSDYEVVKHDPLRCRLVLRHRRTASDPVEQASAERLRAERTITELIGPTAKVVDLQMDGEIPRLIEVKHEAGTKLAAAGYRARIERTVSTVLPGRWRARWDLETDRVVFEVRPSFPESIWQPPVQVDEREDILATYDKVAIPFGVDEDGHVQVWRPAIDPNLMVVGSPGTGKTVLEHNILCSIARYGWPIWVVDGKSIEFLGFRSWPNVQIVATTVWQQVAVIERAWQVMEHRYELITSGRASESDFEPLVLFLDEFADFRANLLDWYSQIKVKGDPTKPPVLQKAASIARKGRSARVHLVFATQRPDAAFFENDMRDNFRMRISMGRLSPKGALMMWQDPATGTTVPRGCRGRATTINDANRVVEVQTYRVPDPRRVHPEDVDLQELLASLRPAISRHERLVIVPPEREPDLDDESGTADLPITYREYAAAEWAKAVDRPDLDPATTVVASADDARALASPMAVFGLIPEPAHDIPASGGQSAAAAGQPELSVPRPRLTLISVQDHEASDRPDADQEPSDRDERFTGYGPPVDVPARLVTIGDLLLADPSTDHWAVVDEEPGDDPSDPDQLALPWRDDADESGLLSVTDGDRVTIRRPLEEV